VTVAHSEIIIIYKSGECEVDLEANGKWVMANVGMELNDWSIARTSSDGELEISVHGVNVTIVKNSKVNLKSLVRNLDESRKLNWFGGVASELHLRNIKGKSDQTQSLGVRGEEIEDEEDFWLDSEVAEETDLRLLEKGKVEYENGNYGEVLKIYSKLYSKSEYKEINEESTFILGSSLFYNLQYDDSLIYLTDSIRHKEAYYYRSALLQYSFAQYFVQNYNAAIGGFETYLGEFRDGEYRPHAIFMIGKSYKALGKMNEAKKNFLEIEKNFKGSEVYRDTQKEMENY
jgi:tetratricopeptide (TPR) repeat protein